MFNSRVNDLPYCQQRREDGNVRGVGLHKFATQDGRNVFLAYLQFSL